MKNPNETNQNCVTIVTRHSYSDGIELLPFRSAKTAKKWVEVDKECARGKLWEEGYTPIDKGNGVTCVEWEDEIYYDWEIDEDIEFLGQKEEPKVPELTKTVMQRCHNCGKIFALKYYSDGHYEYADEEQVCPCESPFSPIHGQPSIGEWTEKLRMEKAKTTGKDGSANTTEEGNMSMYEIIYDYDDEKDIREEFDGTWTELQEYIKRMRENDCYNITATAISW